MNRATLQILRTCGLLLISAAGLAGCAAPSGAGFPTFASIPQAPGDVRSVEGWNIAVQGTQAERQQLLAQTAPGTFSLTNTEGFIAAERSTLAYNPADVPPADQAAISTAWANKMRVRATPPPRPR